VVWVRARGHCMLGREADVWVFAGLDRLWVVGRSR
jgi:hypothetical protein